MRPDPRQADRVVAGAIFAILVGADVGPDNSALLSRGQTYGKPLQTCIVKAHPIDHGAVLGQAKQPWRPIAGLRTGRNRTALDEAETGGKQRIGRNGVLVESRSQADRIWQVEAGYFGAQRRIVISARARPQPSAQPRKCGMMRRLWRQKTQRRCSEIGYHAALVCRRAAKTFRASASSGTGVTLIAAVTGSRP